VRRPGGDQVIPRPAAWRAGAPAPWASVELPERIEVDVLARTFRARGPGRELPHEFASGRPAAVLVALYDGPDGAEVLLTRRAWDLSTHKGEVSFPGGRIDPGETPVEAALREAEEEVALDRRLPVVVGELDHLGTASSRSHIVPVVATLPERPLLVPAGAEVARVLHVPLVDLLRPGTFREEWWGTQPLDRRIVFFELDDETVWGATGRMLLQLLLIALGLES
jgi:8-oxo-dGTP pyrophosphatase MutT (NUDIX family)